ncbi:MAG: FAD-binding protein [Candidatus Peribacteraceae bacterium]|nr:FAD-binding protein [Candidatus Peribacteraceae bacterium]MDD5741869.1 FAD-binding protein [Candidatus Peribacteraceae bacterium]
MQIQELVPLGPRTTMRIGGNARYYADLQTQHDAEEAWQFAQSKGIPMIALGAGSNTIFADGSIEALVVHVTAAAIDVSGNTVRADAGASLATVVTTLARRGLDLSVLTGIPGTVGGAIFGNAGQGPQGMWIDHFVQTVVVFIEGEWKTLSRAECAFGYRESIFKTWKNPLLWKVTLSVPSRAAGDIERDINAFLKKRSVSQPLTRTAGSCFKALPDGTPAWKVIEAANLKGSTAGDLQVSPKHANFLINTGNGTFADARTLVDTIRERTQTPLELEMRFIGESGSPLK